MINLSFFLFLRPSLSRPFGRAQRVEVFQLFAYTRHKILCTFTFVGEDGTRYSSAWPFSILPFYPFSIRCSSRASYQPERTVNLFFFFDCRYLARPIYAGVRTYLTRKSAGWLYATRHRYLCNEPQRKLRPSRFVIERVGFHN